MDLDSLSFTAEQAARALCLYWFSVPPNTMGLMQVKNTAWETLNLKRGMLAKLPSGERQHLFRPPPPHIIFIILVRKQIYLPTQWETFFFLSPFANVLSGVNAICLEMPAFLPTVSYRAAQPTNLHHNQSTTKKRLVSR